MTKEEAIKILSNRDGHGMPSGYNGGYAEAIDLAIEVLKADSFYDGYAYCLMDFGKDTVLCKDCKHLMTYNDGTYDCKYLAERMFAEGELNNKPNDFCCWGERKEVEE